MILGKAHSQLTRRLKTTRSPLGTVRLGGSKGAVPSRNVPHVDDASGKPMLIYAKYTYEKADDDDTYDALAAVPCYLWCCRS